MTSTYGTLGVLVKAITRPMEDQISQAATRAGDKASTQISGRMGRGLQRLAPVAGVIGRSVATGLGVATTAVVAFGVHAFKAASQVEAMKVTLDALAKANGVSAAKVQDTVTAVQKLGITASDAQGFVSGLVRGHIDLAHATDLARIAQNIAASTGKDYTAVQTALTKAILTGNTGALSRQGIVINNKAAEDALAKSLHTTTTNLTQAQKQQATLNAVMQAGKGVAGAYAAQLKTPQGALHLLRVDIANITDQIGGPLVQALTPAFTALAKLGASFSAAIGQGGRLRPIIQAIGSVASRMAAPVTHLINSLSAGFNKIKPSTITKIADAIKRFGPALLGVGSAAAVFTGAGLADKIPVIGGMMGNLMGPLQGLIGDKGFGGLGKSMIGMLPGFKGVGEEVGGLAGMLGKAAGPVGIILTIFTTLMAVSPQFRNAVMELAKALMTALWPVLKAIIAALKPLWPAFISLAKTLGAVLAPVIKMLTPLLIMLAQAIGPILIPIIQALMPLLIQLAPLIAVLAQLIGGLLKVVLAIVVPILKVYIAFEKWYVMKILVPVIHLLIAALAWLVRIITSVVKWIMGGSPGLVPAFLALQKVVTSVTGVIKNVVIAGFTAIRNAITAAWRFITTSSVNTWNAVRNAVAGAIRALTGVVGSGFATIRGLVTRGLAAALSAVVSWGGSLLSAGKGAVAALLHGIASAMSGIGSWVKAHVVDPVVNAVKSFFGIHSPSEVMAGLGENVGKGFISGLVRQNPMGVAKHIFGGIPNALGALLNKGIVSIGSLPAKALSALGKVGGFLKGALTKVTGFFGGLLHGGGGGVGQWAGLMQAVLAHFGIPQLFGTFMTQMQTESGGNPRAINLWDSNAKAGIPSQGLMQVIPPTFAAYAGPYRSRGIMDPLANIYAAVAYAISRYGASIGAVLGHGHGYAAGGAVMEPVTGFGHRSGEMYHFAERGPEWVTPMTGDRLGGRQVTVNVYPQKGQSEVEIAAAVSRRLDWAAATGRA